VVIDTSAVICEPSLAHDIAFVVERNVPLLQVFHRLPSADRPVVPSSARFAAETTIDPMRDRALR
jgi:hypothetical protein